MDRLLTLKETGKLLNVSKQTLQRWDNSGKLIAVRTEGGHRRYKLSDIEKILGENNNLSSDKKEIIVATYARCSTPDQKAHGDIDRQSNRIFEYCSKKGYKVGHVIKDMGSGLNDKRKGFTKLCNLVVNKKIDKVIIEHKDRLTRFGFSYLETMFLAHQVGIIVVKEENAEKSVQEELVEDMISLVTSFSGKLYGMRSKKPKSSPKKKRTGEDSD